MPEKFELNYSNKFNFNKCMKNKFFIGYDHCNHIKRILLMMKLTFFFCLLGLMSVSASVYSQRTKLTLNVDEASIYEVLNQIENQSDFVFIYKSDVIDCDKKVNVNIKKGIVNKVLDNIFKDSGVKYEIIKNEIILTTDRNVLNKNRTNVVIPENRIKGKVTDTDGKPLPGVTITVLGTTRGVITDNDGTYSIDKVNPSDKLVFSFIGMESQIIDVGEKKNIKVEMIEKTEELKDVTVVAYGKQKKESVIGSISTVRPAELKVPSSNLTTSLAGRVAGIISYQRSGEPGQDNADFFVRGVTTFGYAKNPLILIDGIELTTTDLARLQTDDIASFSIMKDATATALYGARGANGVILVTTKEGKEGKAKLSFRVENTFSMPTRDVKFADPVTYMEMNNEAILTRNPLGETLYSDDKIARTAAHENSVIFPATDWHDMLFKNYTKNQRYNMNISGGGKVARYYIAGSFSQDNGILKVDKRNNFNNNIDLKKYTLRTNVNVNITPTTELIARMSGSFDDYSGPLDGGSGMYNKVVHSNPTLFPAYYPVDEAHQSVSHIMFGNYDEGTYCNPYADMVKGYKEYTRSQMTAQMEVHEDFKWITKGLSFRLMMNTIRNSFFSVNRSYNPFYYALDYYIPGTDEYSISMINEDEGTEYLGYNEGDKTISSSFYLEAALNYNRTFNKKHNVSGLLLTTRKNYLDANAGSLQSSLPKRNLGLSGRFTYSYDERYNFEFNFGYNGSERFHEKNRFGFFPSAGVAWNVSNEEFWAPYKKLFSKFRIRATYGLVGNDDIGSSSERFFYLSDVNLNTSSRKATFGDNWGYSRNGVSVSRYANEDITWEIAKKKNLAFEIGMFEHKLEIQAEFFSEYRKNIFMPRADIPVTMGLSSAVKANVGEASSKGTDISIDYNKSWNNSMWLSLRGNYTYATSQYEVYEEPEYKEPWRLHKGKALGQTYGYIAERLFIDDAEVANSPKQNFGEYMAGDIKYTDINRDGQITQADMVPIGYPIRPEIVYGFGFSYGYKHFDFSAFFQGLTHESFWINPSSTSPFNNQTQVLKSYADSYWSEDKRDVYALWPRLSPDVVENNTQPSTWFMRDGSFFRLKEVELGYTLPKKIQKKIHTSLFRIYVSSTNCLTFSKFKLWDIEMGGDGLGYPIQRTFNVGLNISIK